jgi:hypothetical protein
VRQRSFLQSLIARTVLATRLVDYGLGVLRDRFDNLRSKIVLACATDVFYEIYNDLTNDRRKVLRAGAKEFRSDLSHWEKKAISQHFPPPPGTVLVGASGGGREALALARQGYRVVAFDPAGQLVSSLADVCGGLPIESFRGRYEDLPVLNSLSRPPASIDLRSRPLFAAAILGWGSISHLRSDQRCLETLWQFRRLTSGPILVSWIATESGWKKRYFNVYLGYCRCFTGEEIRQMAEEAGLVIVDYDDNENWAVLSAAKLPAA